MFFSPQTSLHNTVFKGEFTVNQSSSSESLCAIYMKRTWELGIRNKKLKENDCAPYSVAVAAVALLGLYCIKEIGILFLLTALCDLGQQG